MAKRAATISLGPDVKRTLHKWVEESTRRQVMAQRAMIVLLAAEHKATQQIARALGIRPARVSKWRTRFAKYGIAGLQTAERPGKPRRYDDSVEARILAQIDQMPPAPHAVWTGPLLADAVGNVSIDYVWRVLRSHHINLRRREQEVYQTASPVVRSLVNLTGIYLGKDASAFLVEVAAREAASTLDRLRTYVYAPNPSLAASLTRAAGAEAHPTLLQALQSAVASAASAQSSPSDSRTLPDFLADARTRSGANRIWAFLTGTRISVPSDVEPHFLNEFETWQDLLGATLAISLEEAAADPTVVPKILSAVGEFTQYARKSFDFEWRAWSVASRSRSLRRSGTGR